MGTLWAHMGAIGVNVYTLSSTPFDFPTLFSIY